MAANPRDKWRARAICDDMGYNPLKKRITRYIELAEIEQELRGAYGFSVAKGGVTSEFPTREDAQGRRSLLLDELAREMDKISTELMPYLFEKPKAIEISGPDGGPVEFKGINVRFVDTDED